jgi:hypothetical protein
MIEILVKIWKPIFDYLNKVKRPVFTIIFMTGILACYLWVKFNDSRIQSNKNRVAIIERQAMLLHKSDSTLARISNIESYIKTIPEQVKQIVERSENRQSKKLEYVIMYIDGDHNRLIHELRLLNSVNTDDEVDTIDLKIGVHKK